MLRKIIIRFVVGCAILMLLAIGSVATVLALASQQPTFYSQLRNQNFSAADQNQARNEFEQLVVSTEQWLRASAENNNDCSLPTRPVRPRIPFHSQQSQPSTIPNQTSKSSSFRRIKSTPCSLLASHAMGCNMFVYRSWMVEFVLQRNRVAATKWCRRWRLFDHSKRQRRTAV